MAKLDVKGVTYASAIVTAIIYVVCAVAFWLAPRGATNFFNYLFHGIDLASVGTKALTLGSAAIGFVIAVVGAAVIAAIFAAVYNRFAE